MNTGLLVLGVSTIIFGIIISYVLVASVFKIGQAMIDIQTQTTSFIEAQRNEIVSTTLIGGAIILIGVLITREAFKR